MTTYVFPGQGSQIKGMGKDLFLEFPDYVQKATDMLGYFVDALCLEDPNNQLNQTMYTQPALYLVNALSYLHKIKISEIQPGYLAGHSLGEYNALFAAGVFDFETGLKIVQKRGQLMSSATGGGMAAVVGLKSEIVQDIIEKNKLTNITIANYNSYTQIVLSGLMDSLKASEQIFMNAGALLFMPLKVSGAFHSKFMDQAQKEFSDYLSQFTFTAPKIPVIANINAKPYQLETIQSQLSEQINHPVKWTQTIEYLQAQGEKHFEEIGPGKILTNLISRIQKGQ